MAEAVQKEIDEKKVMPLRSQYLAQKAGMLGHYNTQFVLLCRSVHSRVRDLEQYLGDGPLEELQTLKWGPDVDGIDDILGAAYECLFIASKAVTELFEVSELDGKFQSSWKAYVQLTENTT